MFLKSAPVRFSKFAVNIAIVIGWMGSGGCNKSSNEKFELEGFLVDEKAPIPLNRSLIFQFRGGLIDPASVQAGGIKIEEDNAPAVSGGKRAIGKFEVSNDNRVVFTPRLASKPDLTDGGFLPGKRYRVVIGGFPHASGIRSTLGNTLEASRVFHFSTIAEGRDLFDDPAAPQRAAVTTDHGVDFGTNGIAEIHVESGARLILHITKPLRPDTVVASNFTVRTGLRGELKLPFEVKLFNDEPGARVEFEMKTPPDTTYPALVEIDPAVTDLGGGGLNGPLGSRFLWVTEQRNVVPSPVIQEFLSSVEFEKDDTNDNRGAHAAWQGDGRLSVHFPRLAGDGSDGAVSLTGNGTIPARVQATKLDIPKAAQVKAVSGTQLSSQGNISISGSLRIVKDEDAAIPGDYDLGIPPGIDVLVVAGGDLEIDGSIQGAASVLLAAGGSVRITKDARLKCKNLRVVAPAGALIEGDVPSNQIISRTPLPQAQSIWIRENILYQSISPWQRAAGSNVTFGNPQWFGDSGSARIRWMFRSAKSSANTPNQVETGTISEWMGAPEDLPAGDRIQFRVEFEIPKTTTEKPLKLPFVDRLVIPTRRL
ncbi:MAG: hypothetical protein HY286_10625 [Planctomycetes bacterium]|nr:hypothetical protein [Planctomycetota bacterium]